jgi:hydrogenase maturation factor
MQTKEKILFSIDIENAEKMENVENKSSLVNELLSNYFSSKEQHAEKNLKLVSDLQNDISEMKESLYSIENKVDLALLTDNFVSRIQMAELGLALKQLDEKGAGEILDLYRENIQDLTKKITSLALPATPTIKPKETKTN